MRWIAKDAEEAKKQRVQVNDELTKLADQANSEAIADLVQRLLHVVKITNLNTVETFAALYNAIEILAGRDVQSMKTADTFNHCSRDTLVNINQIKALEEFDNQADDNQVDDFLRAIFGAA